MQGTKQHLTLLAGAAVVTAALALPTDASAFATNCNKPLAGPQGAGPWQVDFDGGMDGSLLWQGGTVWSEGHGELTVGGQKYPDIPQADADCDLDGTTMTYPYRMLDGFAVRRIVTSVDGQIRNLDVIHNPTGATKLLDADFALHVNGGQLLIDSESGNATATDDDHWSVHETSGGAFQFLQWGEAANTSYEPDVVSEGPDPDVWAQNAGSMPDGTLRYTDVPVPQNASVMLLHVSGATDTQAEAEAAAGNGAAAFAGLVKNTARYVVNWGDDPDKDGVGKSSDDCPSVKGDLANGCKKLVIDLPDGNGNGGGGGTPQPPAPPVPPAPVPTPQAGPATIVPSTDRSAPRITLSGLPRSVTRSRLTGKGLSAKLRCDEACTLSAKVTVKRRGAKRATTVLTARPSRTGAVKLRLGRKALRRLARQRITVAVTATDAAGNRGTLSRTVRIAG